MQAFRHQRLELECMEYVGGEASLECSCGCSQVCMLLVAAETCDADHCSPGGQVCGTRDVVAKLVHYAITLYDAFRPILVTTGSLLR